MKKNSKLLALVLCFVVLAAMLLIGVLVAEPETEPASLVTEASTQAPSEPETIAVTGIIMDQTELNVDVGEPPIQLIATVLPEDATDKAVTWTSSESGVAAVDEKGILTFGYIGKAVITATVGEFSTQCVVTVSEDEATHSAASIPIVVVSGSDYQAKGSDSIVRNIAAQIKKDYASPFGILMGGDYDAGKMYHNASSLEAVDNVITEAFPSIAEENRIMIQGNHEIYGDLSPNSNELLDETGAYENDYYSVYAINYIDFASASNDLQAYLNGKTGYTKPIFVISHQPLHETSRGDNAKGVSIYNVLNEFGENLNIIFLFGHNHSSGHDNYLGGGAIYLKKGDSINAWPNFEGAKREIEEVFQELRMK